jgi:hypothetical protein
MTNWVGLPPPPDLDASIGNANTILQACVTMYQNLWQEEFVVDRFLNEQLNWLLTSESTANFTPSSGIVQQVPSWYAINTIATESTSLVQAFQLQIYTLFTTTNTSATIGNGQGGSATVSSYSALTTTANTALTTANTAITTANTAQTAATAAQTAATSAQTTANIALGNTVPYVFATLAALQASTGIPNNSLAIVQSDPTTANNTVYQLQSGTWTVVNDRLLRALGNPLGYQATWASSVLRTYNDKIGVLTSPEDAGANGNGIFDCGPAFTASSTNGRVLTLTPNKTYLINTSCTVGDIVPNGATIVVNPGVTFTFASIIGDLTVPVFMPTTANTMGTVVSLNNYYSVGWFGGSDASAKWNYCSQGFTAATRKVIYWPIPRTNDPAAAVGTDGVTRWLVSNPININAVHSHSIINCDGTFLAATGVSTLNAGAIQIGPTANSIPTQVVLPEGLFIDCNNVAGYGVQFFAGTGIYARGEINVVNPTINGVQVSNANGITSQVDIDLLTCSGFGGAAFGANLAGQGALINTSPALTNFRIKTLGTQGGKSGCTGLVALAGSMNGVYIDNIVENITTSYYDWTGSMVNVTNTQYGTTTGIGVKIGVVRSLGSARPVLTTADSSGLAQTKIIASVQSIQQSKNSGIPVQLAYAINSSVGIVNTGMPVALQPTLVSCGGDCSSITIEGTHWSAVNSAAPYTNFDGRIGVFTPVNNNTAISLPIPNSFSSQKFDVMVTTLDKTYATGWVGQTGTNSVQGIFVPGYTAPGSNGTFNTNVAVLGAGSLSGSTGTVGDITISSVGDTFYVENRSGNQQSICVLFT